MKKSLFFLCCVWTAHFSFCQDNPIHYLTLKKKGDSLYLAKDYKNSAITFSSAFRVQGAKPTITDRWTAASSWTLSNYFDSAFSELNIIAGSQGLTFGKSRDIIGDRDFILLHNDSRWMDFEYKMFLNSVISNSISFIEVNDILIDELFSPLHNDKRWQDIKEKICLNAYKTFLLDQKDAGGILSIPVQYNLQFSLALGNNDDNAFIHLNDAAYVFLRKKQFEKAYNILKASINNFPPNYVLYQNMVDYYKATGDKERAYVYFSRAEVVKYKKINILSDTLLRIDSAIKAEYRNFSDNIGYEFRAPEYLVTTIANALLKKGMADKAFDLFKMNLSNYPNSFALYEEIGNYYTKRDNKEKANEYFSSSLKIQYKLSDNFFDSSFTPLGYIKSYFQNMSNQKGHLVMPPILMINKLYNYYFTTKNYGKALDIIKMNVDNFPESWDSYARMSELYRAIGDTTKANQFKRQSLKIKNVYLPDSRNGAAVIADSTFNTVVVNPVCSKNCPTIIIDEAHYNSGFTAVDRYKPFATLMINDGYKVVRGREPFTKQLLAKTNVVVIAGPRLMPDSEIQILKDWIIKGGAMLAITDHDNLQFDRLLKSFGVETNEVSLTQDSIHAMFAKDGVQGQGYIVFSESDKLLGNHVIVKGRNQTETVRRVQTFSGRSIVGPPGSSVLLRLSESAVDYMTIDADNIRSRIPVKTKGIRSHGIALTFGKGKVVVISEAATLTAQLFSAEPYRTIDEFGKIGMNTPGSDNKQFTLNIIRWLTGYLK